MTLYNLLHITTALLVGLAAGLFYAYDCSIINGLGNLEDKEYLTSFQSINKAILNPYFFLSFMGSLLLLPLTTWMSYREISHTSYYFLIAATLVYAIGVLGVTMFGNVPLNNFIEQTDLTTASFEELKSIRAKFEPGWNAFHHLRTYASILSFLLVILSLLKKT